MKVEHKIVSNVELKYCGHCCDWDVLSSFYRDKTKWDGYASLCIKCTKQIRIEYNRTHPERMSERNKASYNRSFNKDPEKIRKRYRSYYYTHKEKRLTQQKEARKADPQRSRNIGKKYRDSHKEEISIGQKRYQQQRKNDFTYRVNGAISAGINLSLRGQKNGQHWESLVGYTLVILIFHLEGLFTKGMSWDNYGHGLGKWNIDHIKPIAAFHFTSYDDLEFKECWALQNLRPLWHSENCSKNSLYDGVRIRNVNKDTKAMVSRYKTDLLKKVNEINIKLLGKL